jgi:hypothetical protein
MPTEHSSKPDVTLPTVTFFPQATVNTIDTTVAPYSSHGTNSTTNASDRVYTTQTEGKMELALSGDATSGYTASVTIGLPITSV